MDGCGRTALHRAARKGNRARIEQLLQQGADVEARTRKQGQTPLHIAAAKGHAELLPLLITPATLEALDNQDHTPLDLAVECHQLEVAKVLVAAGASLGGDTLDTNVLCLALGYMIEAESSALAVLCWDAVKADPSSAQVLAEAAQWVDDCGDTPLINAAYLGCQELVTRLLEAGADRDAVGQHGVTALWWAAHKGHVHLVPLLATPANINLACTDPEHCNTPLLTAADLGKDAAVAALLAAGANADARDADGHSALTMAAGSGNLRSMTLLIKALVKKHGKQPPQQPQKKGQVSLLALVAEAAVAEAVQPDGAPWCSQLLEAVLNVLGPEVAAQVCVSVQQQIREEVDRQLQKQASKRPTNPDLYECVQENLEDGSYEPFSHLAEALLLGWVRAQEQLHAGQQPLLARLKHLVAKQGEHDQQQQHLQQLQQDGEEDDDGEDSDEGEEEEELTLHGKVHAKVTEITLFAAAGLEKKARKALAEFAALYLQHLEGGCTRDHTCAESAWCLQAPMNESGVRPFVVMLEMGMETAAELLLSRARNPEEWDGEIAPDIDPAERQQACSFHEPQVYTTFLDAWVRARRELQQLTQEVTDVVVAAVTAAQQQQGLQQVSSEATVTAAATAPEQQQVVLERLPLGVDTTAASATTAAQRQPESHQQLSLLEEGEAEVVVAAVTIAQPQQGKGMHQQQEVEGSEEQGMDKAAALGSLAAAVTTAVGALATACQGWCRELAAWARG
jgi:ankyrin repeat protein